MQTTAAIAIAFAVIAFSSAALTLYKMHPKRVKRSAKLNSAEKYKKVLKLAQKELFKGELDGKAIRKICDFLSSFDASRRRPELSAFLVESIELHFNRSINIEMFALNNDGADLSAESVSDERIWTILDAIDAGPEPESAFRVLKLRLFISQRKFWFKRLRQSLDRFLETKQSDLDVELVYRALLASSTLGDWKVFLSMFDVILHIFRRKNMQICRKIFPLTDKLTCLHQVSTENASAGRLCMSHENTVIGLSKSSLMVVIDESDDSYREYVPGLQNSAAVLSVEGCVAEIAFERFKNHRFYGVVGLTCAGEAQKRVLQLNDCQQFEIRATENERGGWSGRLVVEKGRKLKIELVSTEP